MPRVAPDARVLGLDLALGTTGWAIVECGRLLDHGRFTLPSTIRKGETVAVLDARRFMDLRVNLDRLIRDSYPEYVAVESAAVTGRGWWSGKHSSSTPFYLGMARGLFIGAVLGLITVDRVLLVPMTKAKEIVAGSPSSSKERVRDCLISRYDWPPKEVAKLSLDESDAAAIALAVFGEVKKPWEH